MSSLPSALHAEQVKFPYRLPVGALTVPPWQTNAFICDPHD